MPTRQPACFLAHGSPMSALGHDPHTPTLRAFGQSHSDAKAILVISAHWQRPGPVRLTSWEHAPLVYDFSGFPEELYRITYPAPGSPGLAAHIAQILSTGGQPVEFEMTRGLDHGAWVPLLLAWPEAKIPVIQMSFPFGEPAGLVHLGELLRPLRDEGILIVASGVLVHNLGALRWGDPNAPVDSWAVEFEDWVAAQLASGNIDALVEYRKAPHAYRAVPTPEHFEPLLIAVGAAFPGEHLETIYQGFQFGNLSMRCLVAR